MQNAQVQKVNYAKCSIVKFMPTTSSNLLSCYLIIITCKFSFGIFSIINALL